MKRVTLIVPTFRREKPLIDTLESIRAADYPQELLEVIVIDQTKAHETETEKYLEQAEREKHVRWFRPPEIAFASLTKARNTGIAKASDPDIIIFVDDDVEFSVDFIQRHVQAYEDEQVMAVAGRITVPGHTYPAKNPAEIARVTWAGSFVNNFYGTESRESDGFVGCNFSIRASILKKTGVFDENYIGNAMREETDLAIRIRKVGGIILFVPEAYVIHHMAIGGTRSDGRRDWYYAFFHNHFLFYGKHLPHYRIPFFVLRLWRPIIACSLVYGKGKLSWVIAPWRGIADGLKAAARSKQEGKAVIQHAT